MRRVYDNLEEGLGVLLLAFMALLAFANVVARYFVHYSFAFTEEVEVAGLVWVTALGAAAGFRKGLHLGFELLSLRYPTTKKLLLPLSAALTIVTLAVLFYYSLFQIKDEIILGITSEALAIPQWWYTVAIPVGVLLMVWRVVEYTYNQMKGGSS